MPGNFVPLISAILRVQAVSEPEGWLTGDHGYLLALGTKSARQVPAGHGDACKVLRRELRSPPDSGTLTDRGRAFAVLTNVPFYMYIHIRTSCVHTDLDLDLDLNWTFDATRSFNVIFLSLPLCIQARTEVQLYMYEALIDPPCVSVAMLLLVVHALLFPRAWARGGSAWWGCTG